MTSVGVRFGKLCSLAKVALLCAFLSGLSLYSAERAVNLDEQGVALQGYDPVSYFSPGGPAKGDASLKVARDGVTYLFANDKNHQAFMAAPERYEPAFGGWCAWAMLEGDEVEVDPESFRVFDGKLLLFYDGFWGDTRAKWQKRAKLNSERELFSKATAEWKLLQLK